MEKYANSTKRQIEKITSNGSIAECDKMSNMGRGLNKLSKKYQILSLKSRSTGPLQKTTFANLPL
jgi:hypothetical protein